MGKLSDITIDMNTGKFQQKLSAIAKHTEALAQELKEIDEAHCDHCGSHDVEVMSLTFMDGQVERVAKECLCKDCNEITGLPDNR